MGAATGMYFCVREMGGFAGPLIVGAIRDWSGGFLAGVICIAGFSLATLIIALSLRIRPTSDTKASHEVYPLEPLE